MQKYDQDIYKYWATQNGYFRLATTVTLGMGITDGKLLYYHGVTEVNVDKKISTFEYKNRTVYECFNYHFTSDFVSPAMNLPPITIDDRPPPPHKIVQYTPYLLPSTIFVASENSDSNLTTPSDSPDILTTDDTNNIYVMKKDDPYSGRLKRGYCFRKHGIKRCYKKTMFYCYTCSD